MSLSCVVPGNFQSFIAGVVCEDMSVEANEFNPLDSCVFHNFCININNLIRRKRSTLWLIWVQHVKSCMEIFPIKLCCIHGFNSRAFDLTNKAYSEFYYCMCVHICSSNKESSDIITVNLPFLFLESFELLQLLYVFHSSLHVHSYFLQVH